MLDMFIITRASERPNAERPKTYAILWEENKGFSNQERCLSFFVYLSGSFDMLRIVVEKSNGSTQVYPDIFKGPAFGQWQSFHLKIGPQNLDDIIIFEASANGTEGVFALDQVANRPFQELECMNPSSSSSPPTTSTVAPTEPPQGIFYVHKNEWHFFSYYDRCSM